MIAARTTHHQAASVPGPRRSVLDTLLLRGMAWTDANQWFPAAGLVLTIIAAGIAEKFL